MPRPASPAARALLPVLLAALFVLPSVPSQAAGTTYHFSFRPGSSSGTLSAPVPSPSPSPASAPSPVPPSSDSTDPATPVQPSPSPSAQPQPERARLLALVQAARQETGVGPLAPDPVLNRLAQLKAEDIASVGYFSHVSPTLGSPFAMLRSAGVRYRTAGENLALAPTVEAAHASLMASPGHRRNLLKPGYDRLGIGIARHAGYGLVVVELFVGG